MKKRVFIVHGWDYSPRMNWYASIKTELEKKGYAVSVPKMPDPSNPKISAWVKELKKQVKTVDADTYFIGHSVGCQTIIRYLGLQKKQCGGALFVAGWFVLRPEATPDAAAARIAKPWLTSPIPFNEARATLNTSMAILSNDDPYVPIAPNTNVFENVLGTKVLAVKNAGHFEGKNYPIIAKEFAKLTK